MSISVALLNLPEDTGAFVEEILPLSADAHRKRALGFQSNQRRAEFLAGRRLLALLYEQLAIDFSWPDEQPESAPPAVHTGEATCSSISHSGKLVVAAVGKQLAGLGIDCESARRNNNLGAISRRHFTSGEADRLAQAPEQEQQTLFLKHWVLKEAWLKSTEQGIGGGFEAVELLADNRVKVHAEGFGAHWNFWLGRYSECPLGLCWDSPQALTPHFFEALEFLSARPELTPAQHLSGDHLK